MEDNKEKKTITLSLSTGVSLIIIIMLSVVILAMAYFYNFKDVKGKNLNQPENNQSTNISPTQVVEPKMK